MINLPSHPVFKGLNPFKKRGHLTRFYLAKQYARMLPREMFIGITGSVGKTLTTQACQAVLSEKFVTISTTETISGVANLDSVFNLPMTILRVKPKVKRVILELGIERPGEMELYLSLIRPQKAIVTRINYQHTEFLGSLENIITEKGKLVEQLPKEGVAILNWDDPNTRRLAERTSAEVVYFGIDPKNCHVWAGNMKIQNFCNSFELNYGVERIVISSKTLGFHQIYPMLAAASLAITEGMSLTTIKKGLEKIEPLEHRMQALVGVNGSVVLDDTYNAAPVAVEEAIETLSQVPARRRIVVLGEMKELGEFSEKMHRQIARKIVKDKIDLCLIGTGDAKFIADELLSLGFIPERLHSGLSNSQIVGTLLKLLGKGDVVLIKGARATRLDEVVKRVSKGKK